jgi:hypothetical protein
MEEDQRSCHPSISPRLRWPVDEASRLGDASESESRPLTVKVPQRMRPSTPLPSRSVHSIASSRPPSRARCRLSQPSSTPSASAREAGQRSEVVGSVGDWMWTAGWAMSLPGSDRWTRPPGKGSVEGRTTMSESSGSALSVLLAHVGCGKSEAEKSDRTGGFGGGRRTPIVPLWEGSVVVVEVVVVQTRCCCCCSLLPSSLRGPGAQLAVSSLSSGAGQFWLAPACP